MPHFKCVPCKARVYRATGGDDLVGGRCPGCGSLLEPVGELGEIVGFRSIDSRGDAAPDTHQRIVDQVEDLFARREAALARAHVDAERWLDDGGSFSPDAVAAAMALSPPEEKP